MADDTRFTLRRYDGKCDTIDEAFRIHFNPDDFNSLHLSLGECCLLKSETGVEGAGIAWRLTASNKNRRLLMVSDELKDLYGFKLGDRLTVMPHAERPIATEVTVRRVGPSNALIDPNDTEISIPYALYSLDALWSGGKFIVQTKNSKSPKERFEIVDIKGNRTPEQQLTPWLFRKGTALRFQSPEQEITGRKEVADAHASWKPVDFSGIGGLRKEIERLNDELKYMAMLADRSNLSARYLLDDHPSRVMLHGMSGTGKTLVFSKMRASNPQRTFEVNTRSKQGLKAEQSIAQTFESATARQPCVLLIDDIDDIAGKDGPYAHALKAEIDKLGSAQVMVIAAARNINDIDDRLRPKFDCEIELPVPSREARLDILRAFSSEESLSPDDHLLRNISDLTHGYTGHDLRQVARQAQMRAALRSKGASDLRGPKDGQDVVEPRNSVDVPSLDDRKERKVPASNGVGTDQEFWPSSVTDKLSTMTLDESSINAADFDHARKLIRPSAMRALYFETPHVSWSDIGGSEAVKEALWQVVDMPLKHPDIMARSPYKPPRGILLYGPPGCSKTLTARAIASSSGLNFISIKGAELTDMYVGESERKLREVFRKARMAAPSVIFFDEVDAIAAAREGGHSTPGLHIVTTLLTEMDGVDSEALRDVLVLAATNRPDVLDPALMRPGRFDTVLYVPPPPLAARKQILELHIRHDIFSKNLDIDQLAQRTDGYSGAEIVEICNKAAGAWNRREVEKKLKRLELGSKAGAEAGEEDNRVTAQDFENAFAQVHKIITHDMVRKYEEWAAQRGDVKQL